MCECTFLVAFKWTCVHPLPPSSLNKHIPRNAFDIGFRWVLCGGGFKHMRLIQAGCLSYFNVIQHCLIFDNYNNKKNTHMIKRISERKKLHGWQLKYCLSYVSPTIANPSEFGEVTSEGTTCFTLLRSVTNLKSQILKQVKELQPFESLRCALRVAWCSVRSFIQSVLSGKKKR